MGQKMLFSLQTILDRCGKVWKVIIPIILKFKVKILIAILHIQLGLHCNITCYWKKHPMLKRNLLDPCSGELKVEALGFPNTLKGPFCITRGNNPKDCFVTLQSSFSITYHQNLVSVLGPFYLVMKHTGSENTSMPHMKGK
jgi:hypothetical protein